VKRKQLSVTKEKIRIVKEGLANKKTIGVAAGKAGVSYKTAWLISKGYYDNDNNLPIKKGPDSGYLNYHKLI
jgi:hypothetical protein